MPGVDPNLVEQLDKARAAEARPRVGPVGIAGIVAVLAGVALVATGVPIAGAGVALVGLLLVVVPLIRREKPPASMAELQTRVTYQQEARRQAESKRQRAEDRASELGLGADPAELRRLARLAEDAEANSERFAKWQARVQGLEHELERAETALRAALEDRGVAGAGDEATPAEELVERYRRECRSRSAAAAQARRRDDLEAQLKARLEVERSWEERRRRREEPRGEALRSTGRGRYRGD